MIDYKTKHRKYKIANILGKEYNDMDFIKIYNHYKKNMDISKMKIFTDVRHPNSIYYGYSKNDIYIEHGIKSNIFWLSYDKIWSFFETEFDYKYIEIKELTTIMFKEHLHLNLKDITSNDEFFHKIYNLKEHLNLKDIATAFTLSKYLDLKDLTVDASYGGKNYNYNQKNT